MINTTINRQVKNHLLCAIIGFTFLCKVNVLKFQKLSFCFQRNVSYQGWNSLNEPWHVISNNVAFWQM